MTGQESSRSNSVAESRISTPSRRHSAPHKSSEMSPTSSRVGRSCSGLAEVGAHPSRAARRRRTAWSRSRSLPSRGPEPDPRPRPRAVSRITGSAGRRAPNRREHLEPVAARKHHVEQHEVESPLSARASPSSPSAAHRLRSPRTRDPVEEVGDPCLILDDQDPHLLRDRRHAPMLAAAFKRIILGHARGLTGPRVGEIVAP